MTGLPQARVLFAGGGTGGHLYPALAIANRLMELAKDQYLLEINFVGTRRGIEYRLKDQIGYPLHLINMRGLARSVSLKNLLLPFVVIAALVKSSSILTRFSPDVVVGTGGYVAWPVLRAAVAMKIPTLIQEQNSYPGIVTRRLAPRVNQVFLGFEQAAGYLAAAAYMTVSGNPVRSDLTQGDREQALASFNLDPSKKTILILGGSQGARAVNRAMIQSIKAGSLPTGYQLLWQTGTRDYKDVTAEVGNRVSNCALFPFVQDMAAVYAATDLALARAGALTLAELELCGIPAILVPFPYAAEDHQRRNAEALVALGGAEMILEKDLDGHDLLAEAGRLLQSEKYHKMKAALEKSVSGREPATDTIARAVLNLIAARKRKSKTA